MYKRFCFLIIGLTLAVLAQAAQPWSAKWIQAAGCRDSANTWQVFRKEVRLNAIPRKLAARIAADSKYWLWVNGQMAVFEGGLKRGPSPHGTYYDEIDIAPYLQKGNNTIALLTVYFGKEGFSHKDSGHGALLFEAGEACGASSRPPIRIVSDETWHAAVYPAYGTLRHPAPNWRLPESNICFDARKSWGKWYMPQAKRKLPKAKVLCDQAENAIFGQLVRRPIPLFKDFGLKDYVSTSYDAETGVLACRLPYDAQVTPYLEVEAGPGSGDTIFIYTDHAKVGAEDCVTAAYIPAEGHQAYESLGWMNGDMVYYKLPKGVEAKVVKYRETGYDTEMVSGFRCSDSFFNELWQRSVRTMYVNMRDTYFDCPDRERSQWWGDIANDIQQSFYVFSPTAWPLVTKGIHELMNWQRSDGTLFSPIPAGNWDKELPCQMLMAVGWYGFRAQAFYSGDYGFVPVVYDRLHRYLHEVWQVDSDGFAQVREGGWSFADWGRHIDLELLTAEWYYLALKAELEFAQRIGRDADATMIGQMMEKMRRNFNRRFWQGSHYRSSSYKDPEIDDRAQALAVLCGFADQGKYAALKEVFVKSRHASPWLELYVQLALFQMGEGKLALERAKERFAQMLAYGDKTTLFEHWGVSASTNHGWSSGMTTILAQEVCGIRPTAPGFQTFEIRPQLSGLASISTNVETHYGFIRVAIEEAGGKTRLTLTVPRGTTATVRLGQTTRTLGEGTHEVEAP